MCRLLAQCSSDGEAEAASAAAMLAPASMWTGSEGRPPHRSLSPQLASPGRGGGALPQRERGKEAGGRKERSEEGSCESRAGLGKAPTRETKGGREGEGSRAAEGGLAGSKEGAAARGAGGGRQPRPLRPLPHGGGGGGARLAPGGGDGAEGEGGRQKEPGDPRKGTGKGRERGARPSGTFQRAAPGGDAGNNPRRPQAPSPTGPRRARLRRTGPARGRGRKIGWESSTSLQPARRGGQGPPESGGLPG